MNQKGLVQILLLGFIAAVLIAGLSFGYVKYFKNENENTNSVTNENENLNTNTAVNINKNENANITLNANTSQSSYDTGLNENYNISNLTKYVATGYVNYVDNEAFYYIKVLDVTTGDIVREKELKPEYPILSSSYASFGSSNSIQFGADGDSIMFLAGTKPSMRGSEHIISGLYQTSWSAPEKIEKIVNYQDDARINSWLFDAERNRALFFLEDIINEKFTLYSVDLDTKLVTRIKGYSELPYLTFLGLDTNSIYNITQENDSNRSAGNIYLEKVDLTTGGSVNNLIYKPGASISLPAANKNSLSPNRKLFVSWDDALTIRTLPDNIISKPYTWPPRNNNICWTADSSNVILIMQDDGKVYNVNTEEIVATIPELSYTFIGAPGNYVIYETADYSLRSYSFDTQKITDLNLNQHPSLYLGFNWLTK